KPSMSLSANVSKSSTCSLASGFAMEQRKGKSKRKRARKSSLLHRKTLKVPFQRNQEERKLKVMPHFHTTPGQNPPEKVNPFRFFYDFASSQSKARDCTSSDNLNKGDDEKKYSKTQLSIQ